MGVAKISAGGGPISPALLGLVFKDNVGNPIDDLPTNVSYPSARDFYGLFALGVVDGAFLSGKLGNPSATKGALVQATLTRGHESFHPKYILQKAKNLAFLTGEAPTIFLVSNGSVSLDDIYVGSLPEEGEAPAYRSSIGDYLNGSIEIPSGVFGPKFTASILDYFQFVSPYAAGNGLSHDYAKTIVDLGDGMRCELHVMHLSIFEKMTAPKLTKLYETARSTVVPSSSSIGNASDLFSLPDLGIHINQFFASLGSKPVIFVPHLYNSVGGEVINGPFEKLPIFAPYVDGSVSYFTALLNFVFGESTFSYDNPSSRIIKTDIIRALAMPLVETIMFERFSSQQSEWLPIPRIPENGSNASLAAAFLKVYNRLSEYGSNYSEQYWEDNAVGLSIIEKRVIGYVKGLEQAGVLSDSGIDYSAGLAPFSATDQYTLPGNLYY